MVLHLSLVSDALHYPLLSPSFPPSLLSLSLSLAFSPSLILSLSPPFPLLLLFLSLSIVSLLKSVSHLPKMCRLLRKHVDWFPKWLQCVLCVGAAGMPLLIVGNARYMYKLLDSQFRMVP